MTSVSAMPCNVRGSDCVMDKRDLDRSRGKESLSIVACVDYEFYLVFQLQQCVTARGVFDCIYYRVLKVSDQCLHRRGLDMCM